MVKGVTRDMKIDLNMSLCLNAAALKCWYTHWSQALKHTPPFHVRENPDWEREKKKVLVEKEILVMQFSTSNGNTRMT